MEMLFTLFGGLALFIFGMNAMGDGLKQIAGEKMSQILDALTTKPILGVAVGAVVTSIIQSSSATTVMVIGFVNAGLMSLKQAIAVIMGANIGTTITGQLLTFNLTSYFFPMIAVGFFIYIACKKQTVKQIGYVLFAFGVLFMGLDVMSVAMAPLRTYPGFQDFMVRFSDNKIVLLLLGVFITVVIQSSSAAIGIAIAMAEQGLIGLDAALPALLGMNIGTCITAVLASFQTSLTAKRAAAAHVTFNIIGAVVFLIFMSPFEDFVYLISGTAGVERQIANAHTLFNIITTVLFFPFIGMLERFVTKAIPGEERIIKRGAIYLEPAALSSVDVALSFATRELIRMGEYAKENIDKSSQALISRDLRNIGDVYEVEEVVDSLEKDIIKYLAKISLSKLNANNSNTHATLFHGTNDLERISDHSVNIAQAAELCVNTGIFFSKEAENELKTMYETVSATLGEAIECIRQWDVDKALDVIKQEKAIDMMEKQFRKNHIQRYNEGNCETEAGVVFLDIISNFERVGDHANNLAQMVAGKF